MLIHHFWYIYNLTKLKDWSFYSLSRAINEAKDVLKSRFKVTAAYIRKSLLFYKEILSEFSFLKTVLPETSHSRWLVPPRWSDRYTQGAPLPEFFKKRNSSPRTAALRLLYMDSCSVSLNISHQTFSQALTSVLLTGPTLPIVQSDLKS